MYCCLYYNIYVAASVTSQGRALVSSAGMCFEQFLANNVKFGSLDEVITFIDNVNMERNERKYNDNVLLDKNISVFECFQKIIYTCGFEWIPSMEQMNMIYDILCKLDQETINRLYYKNNLLEFISNSKIATMIDKLLEMLNTPFLNPNEPPEEIQDELDVFTEIVLEYVYYHHMIIDSVDRMDNMEKKVVMISDTDSNIICLDHWYRHILENIAKGREYDITKEHINLVDFLDDDVELDKSIIRFNKPELTYDFYDDKVTEVKRAINLAEVLPQDNLRYSIINILAYILDKVINDYMIRFCKKSNSYDGNCLIIMKNEYVKNEEKIISIT